MKITHEFWYWYDKHFIAKPFWRTLIPFYIVFFIATILISLVEKKIAIFGAGLLVFCVANLIIGTLNLMIAEKYFEPWWDFRRNKRQ